MFDTKNCWPDQYKIKELIESISSNTLINYRSYTPQDFSIQIQDGINKGKNALWFLAWFAAFSGNFKNFLNVFEYHKEAFKAEDFTVQAQEGSAKGQSVLWSLSHSVVNGELEAFQAVFARYKNTFSAEDFTAQAQEGVRKGQSPLFLLVVAATNGHSDIFLSVFEQYKDTFKKEDFTVQAQAGENQGKNPLWFLIDAAINGKPEAFHIVFKHYENTFATEDFTNPIQIGAYKNKNIISLLQSAAEEHNQDAQKILQQIDILSRNKAKQRVVDLMTRIVQGVKLDYASYTVEDFTIQLHEDPYKGISALLLLVMRMAHGQSAAFFPLFKLYKSEFQAKDFTVQIENGLDKGKSALWFLCGRYGISSFLLVFNQYKEAFKVEDFTAQAQEGEYKGQSSLFLLIAGAINGHPEAFEAVFQQYKSEFKVEDFKSKVQEGTYKGKSTLSLLQTAASTDKNQYAIQILNALIQQMPALFVDKAVKLIDLIRKGAEIDFSIYSAEDFTAQVQDGLGICNGETALLHLSIAASKGNATAFQSVFNQYKNEFKAEDFTTQLQKGLDKGKNVLWFLSSGVPNGSFSLFLSVFQKYKDAFNVEDFTAQAQAGPYKGRSVLWRLSSWVSNGQFEAFDVVFERFKENFKAEDFTVQVKKGPDEGQSPLWLLARGVSKLEGLAVFLSVFEQYKNNFSVENFRTQAQRGPYEGQYILWNLAVAAINGNPQAFHVVFQKYKDELKIEDFTVKVKRWPHKAESILSLLKSAVERDNQNAKEILQKTDVLFLDSISKKAEELIHLIVQGISVDYSIYMPEVFTTQVQKGVYKGKTVLWVLASLAGTVGFQSVFSHYKDLFKAEVLLLQEQDGANQKDDSIFRLLQIAGNTGNENAKQILQQVEELANLIGVDFKIESASRTAEDLEAQLQVNSVQPLEQRDDALVDKEKVTQDELLKQSYDLSPLSKGAEPINNSLFINRAQELINLIQQGTSFELSSYTAKDFTIQSETRPFRGENPLVRLAMTVSINKTKDKIFQSVFEHFKNDFIAENFTEKVAEGSLRGNSPLLYLAIAASKGKTDAFQSVFEYFKNDFKVEDFTTQAQEGYYKNQSPLLYLIDAFSNGHAKAVQSVFEQYKNDFTAEDYDEFPDLIKAKFTIDSASCTEEDLRVQAQNSSIQSLEQKDEILVDREKQDEEATQYDLFKQSYDLSSLSKDVESINISPPINRVDELICRVWFHTDFDFSLYTAKDFTAQAKEKPFKGENPLIRFAMSIRFNKSANKNFQSMFEYFKNDFTAQDFTVRVRTGNLKGNNPLFYLAIAVSKGHPDAFHSVFEHFKNDFAVEDFTARTQEGRYQGKSSLLYLIDAFSNGHAEAFRTVFEQYKNDFTAEDFEKFSNLIKAKVTIDSTLCTAEDLKKQAQVSSPQSLEQKDDILVDKEKQDEEATQDKLFKQSYDLPPLSKDVELISSPLPIVEDLMAQSNKAQELIDLIMRGAAIDFSLYTAEDFSTQIQQGLSKGQSPLRFLTTAAINGKPQKLLVVLEHYQDTLTVDDFNQSINDGPYKGKNALSLLENAAQRGNKNALLVLQQVNALGENKEKTVLSAGISNKYLRPENRATLSMPKNISLNLASRSAIQQKSIVQNISLEMLSKQAKLIQQTHQMIYIQNKNCKIRFYSMNPVVKKDEPCVFIMAGRKENAYFSPPQKGIRTILVLSEKDLKEMAHPIPASLDYLVIEELMSASHGVFKEEILGMLVARRITAFMFSHHFNLNYCIVCDDNISTFLLNEQIENLDSKVFYQKLISHLNKNLCLSLQTISNKPLSVETKLNVALGSKIFAYNMSKLKEIFNDSESLFYLFPPANCVKWWGEDYFMQYMLNEVAYRIDGVPGILVLSKNDFGGLERCTQHKNACKKAISTAEDYIEKTSAFLQGINFERVQESFRENIKNSITHMCNLVNDRVYANKEKQRRLLQLNLENIHAVANNIEVIRNINDRERPIAHLNTHAVFAQASTQVEMLKDILYKHQYQALETLLSKKNAVGHMAMCTGSGKTRVQIALAHLCCTQMKRPIFIVAPTQELVQQTYNEFIETQTDFANRLKTALFKQEIIKISSKQEDVSQGFLHKKHQENKNVFIFCEESFKLFMMDLERHFNPGLIIFDEYHDIARDTISITIERLSSEENTPVIGLSATPTKDKKKDAPLAQQLFRYSRLDALKDGRVVPIVTDTFSEKYSKEHYQKKIAKISEILKIHFHPNGKLLCNNKGIIFVNSILDVDRLTVELNHLGIQAFGIHSKADNENIVRFRCCLNACVAVAVRKMRVGFDDSSVNYVLDLQNTKDEDIFIQMIGRVMRVTDTDPKKIGYVISFKDIHKDTFITTDNAALKRSNSIYIFRQRALDRLKAIKMESNIFTRNKIDYFSKKIKHTVNSLYREYKSKLKPEITEVYSKEKQLENKGGQLYSDDCYENICDIPAGHDNNSSTLYSNLDAYKAWKTKARAEFAPEYDFFKKSSLFLCLQKLKKECLPENQRLLESKAPIYVREKWLRTMFSVLEEIVQKETIGVNEVFKLQQRQQKKKKNIINNSESMPLKKHSKFLN
ncbi:DEAD/DEAH box helicase family protein [Candidatus Berkiella cookevillensis]|uniref:DEAD/DEAH box helicase family protein n=1 Tax=Candidatus Berkiella cookevillensis TaxID=437022 RepID=A0A0Q9YFK2_9GAMM|nr:DEAD/DEAH box helicase family protein [Candidatus Berkiella cookevillensis]MCS5708938.1 DEAD/DEAH box helicase family protein [Candidatus Berkiella cookevillensis]